MISAKLQACVKHHDSLKEGAPNSFWLTNTGTSLISMVKTLHSTAGALMVSIPGLETDPTCDVAKNKKIITTNTEWIHKSEGWWSTDNTFDIFSSIVKIFWYFIHYRLYHLFWFLEYYIKTLFTLFFFFFHLLKLQSEAKVSPSSNQS